MSGYGEPTGRRAGEGGAASRSFAHDYHPLVAGVEMADPAAPRRTGGGGYGGKKYGGGGYGGGGYGGYDDDDRAGLMSSHRNEEQSQFMDAQFDDFGNIIREREQAVEEIENTMLEVNEIYRDLAQLVDEQGEHLDNIENNMTLTDERVESGAGQLVKASKYQKQARTKSLWCLGISLAVLAVVFALAFGIPKFGGKGGSDAGAATSSTASPTTPPPTQPSGLTGSSSTTMPPTLAPTTAPPTSAPTAATTATPTTAATTTGAPTAAPTAAPTTSRRLLRRDAHDASAGWDAGANPLVVT